MVTARLMEITRFDDNAGCFYNTCMVAHFCLTCNGLLTPKLRNHSLSSTASGLTEMSANDEFNAFYNLVHAVEIQNYKLR